MFRNDQMMILRIPNPRLRLFHHRRQYCNHHGYYVEQKTTPMRVFCSSGQQSAKGFTDNNMVKMKMHSATMKWLQTIVIDEKLCPFAPPVKQPPKLRVFVSNGTTHDEIVADIASEAKLVVGSDEDYSDTSSATKSQDTKPETTLVLLDESKCPSLTDFYDLVRLSWQVQEEAINDNGYGDNLQIVLFHPKATHDTYAMIGEEEDPADYTIRSPYPMIHLLRQVDVMAAVTSGYKDLEGLPSRNKARMRQNGLDACIAKLNACYDV